MLLRHLRALASRGREAGQTTAEYALVILGAAVVAGLLIAWARGGALKQLFDSVLESILP